MASIELVDASVEIPIFNSRGRSLKTTLIRRVGGQVETDDHDVVTVKALRHLNLSLKPGDRLALVGHNGAGKSTLLRVFAGSYEPSRGRADIRGTVSSLIDMEMGMDPELTGADNIILRSVFVGMSLREAKRSIPQIAEFSELGPYLHLPMRTYSSGMRMRLAFATSTTRHPDILLFDEMISFGDAGFASRAKQRLYAMMDKAKILALASHDLGSLKTYCNRAILLEAGSIVAEGSVDEVWKRYMAAVEQRNPPDQPEPAVVDGDPANTAEEIDQVVLLHGAVGTAADEVSSEAAVDEALSEAPAVGTAADEVFSEVPAAEADALSVPHLGADRHPGSHDATDVAAVQGEEIAATDASAAVALNLGVASEERPEDVGVSAPAQDRGDAEAHPHPHPHGEPDLEGESRAADDVDDHGRTAEPSRRLDDAGTRLDGVDGEHAPVSTDVALHHGREFPIGSRVIGIAPSSAKRVEEPLPAGLSEG